MSKKITVLDQNARRECLSEILPLKFPLSIRVNVCNRCNFQCFYCTQVLPIEKQKEVCHTFGEEMKLSDFRLWMDDIRGYGKLKSLVLTGLGEPLLNDALPEMIAYAKKIDIANRIDLVTNAFLLTPKKSDALIAAGLDRLRVSIQGTTPEDYWNNAKVKIDYPHFIEQLLYFYQHKKDCVVYIKIMDEMLKKEGTKERFYELYENVSDELAIESLVPIRSFDLTGKSQFQKTILGMPVTEIKVCNQPFYSVTMDSDGAVYPCCNYPYPSSFGNMQDGFDKIWLNRIHKEMLIKMLTDQKNQIPVCKECISYKFLVTENDYLDHSMEKLRKKYALLGE